MKASYLLFSAFLLFAFQSVPAFSQINRKIDDKYEARYEMKIAQVLEYMEERIDYELEQDMHFEVIVEGMEDGLYKLSFVPQTVQLTLKQLGEELKYDSTNEEDFNNPEWAEMKEVLNMRTVAKIDDKGVVRDTEGTYDLQLFGDRNGLFLYLPESLSIGESWTEKTNSEKQKNEITYTLKEISGTKAVLSTQGTIDMTLTKMSDGKEIITRSVGTFTGEADVDKSTYLILESMQLMDMEVTVETMGEKIVTPSTTRIRVKNRKL